MADQPGSAEPENSPNEERKVGEGNESVGIKVSALACSTCPIRDFFWNYQTQVSLSSSPDHEQRRRKPWHGLQN
ncbi:uncharacterized protein VTP21DRAFT_2440 [Calcarisporiella thermophila]|uniref:uncharacterized protein n=1 Tax=Calcarisporiella thermophila TaxID=911321 RepID=UPI0037429D76